jgi:restriction endonuclease S subunit
MGRSAVVDSSLLPANTNQALAIIRVKQEVISPIYLSHLLRSSRILSHIESVKAGVAQYNVSLQQVGEIEIPLPPLAVQREIVAEIEGYQKVINGARAVLDHYRPHIPIHPDWPLVELGEVCELYQPKTITGDDLIENGPYLVFGANGVIGRYNQFNHEESEVLITCRGATCGTINKSEPKSWITGNAMVAKPKDERLSRDFLFSLLKGSDLASTISGSAQPQITRQSIAPFKIPLPPIEAQQKIVAEIEVEQALVGANRELIQRFEQKIQTTLARIWGEENQKPDKTHEE